MYFAHIHFRSRQLDLRRDGQPAKEAFVIDFVGTVSAEDVAAVGGNLFVHDFKANWTFFPGGCRFLHWLLHTRNWMRKSHRVAKSVAIEAVGHSTPPNA